MKKLFLTFRFAAIAGAAMFMSAQTARAAWWSDDDYRDDPWYYDGVPWYGGYYPLRWLPGAWRACAGRAGLCMSV